MTSLSDYEKADLLYREWEYRHGVVWKTVQLWGAVTILIIVAPFIRAEFANRDWTTLVFPLLGIFLSVVGGWNLASEAERLGVVAKEYDHARGFRPAWPYVGQGIGLYQRAVTISTAKTLARIFHWGLGSASFAAGLLLVYLNNSVTERQGVLLLFCVVVVLVMGTAIAFRDIWPKVKRD